MGSSSVISLSESALDRSWADLRRAGRTGLVPYLTAGFPTVSDSLAALQAADAHSDVIGSSAFKTATFSAV